MARIYVTATGTQFCKYSKRVFLLFLLPICVFIFMFYMTQFNSGSPTKTTSNFADCFRAEVAGSKDENSCARKFNLDQESPELVEYVRKHHVFAPPPVANKLCSELVDGFEDKVRKRVWKLLKNKTEGFFIEAGANDGVFLSNTLALERDHNWTGLLVEADPVPYKILAQRYRKAWLTDVCLSAAPYPTKVTMKRHDTLQGISYDPKQFKGWSFGGFEEFVAPCFPLLTILRAVGVTRVDYFSMDMEGAELAVLKTFPFEEIPISILSIEMGHGGSPTELLKSKGYVLDEYMTDKYTHDQIFVHESIREEKSSE